MSADIRSVADITRHHAAVRPDAPAMWFEGAVTTYAELDEQASRCAQALIAAGVKRGERVGVLAKGHEAFFVLWFGCLKAGACLTPVNWRLAPPEIAFVLKDAGCRLVVAGADFAPILAKVQGDIPALETIVQVEPGHSAWPDFAGWIGGFPAEDPQLPADPQDDVIQLYTSGTTGLPKGVQLTEQNYATVFESALKQWAQFSPGMAVLVAMPLFHVAGANLGMLAFLQGAKAIVLREPDPGVILKVIEQHRIEHAFLVPALINMILQRPEVGQTDLSSVRNIYYGASPISEEVLKRAQATFPAQFTQLYGLTETIGGGTNLPPEAHDPARGKLRSCGVPSEGFEVRVRIEERDAEPFEVGEIEIRSSGVMKGYWNRPDATAQAICPQGWFRSGDAGYFDDEGFLFIHDRVKDMIVSGGENIYPAEVENALFSHPDVADAAAVGVPDERWGEAVKAFVVLRPDAKADGAAIMDHCRALIAGYKVPKSVDFIAVLPRNPSGKVLRRELRAPYWEGRERNVG